MFETTDGQPIEVGYFVTLEGEKIRKANNHDTFILGITSSNPSFLADSGELRWKGKFLQDEWGKLQFHDVVIPTVKDKDGEVIIPERIEIRPIVNPIFDPTKTYIPRLERPEWEVVGLLGKLLVRDDGTCQENEFCRPNKKGISTTSKEGY
ncbi:peptidase G2 autoproteolytic cleavage domain-containing protein [Bacillus cereus]|uniref:peptidase G2 autoproteolytic cleavage domain-containing protein n=1 Tax=Bacillus cereus TaxID=1396 RepID=UPI000E595F14|nr:peptidase G2 autoproteolytic cleavage domain-containing protein [Bacillus cereus]RHW07174.1 hypothetical protein B7P27_19085 [Bacillus cereus]